MSDTLIWITGATDGIGAELAKQAPYPGSRIINLSRRKHPDHESVYFDLTEPATWDNVRRHIETELAKFKGDRVLFFQNATWMAGYGDLNAVSPDIYRKALLGLVTAPLAIGEMFVRACRPGFESGLVMMSAGAAVACLDGCSAYGAGKIALEHWTQVIDQELGRKPGKPWVVAIRPGGVLSAGVRRLVEDKDVVSPNAAHVRANAHRRLSPARAAAEIWKVLPPPPGISLIALAGLPYPDLQFEARRMKQVDVPNWQLVYR